MRVCLGHTGPIDTQSEPESVSDVRTGTDNEPDRTRGVPSRRAILAGGLVSVIGGVAGAGVLVQRDVLPGRIVLARLLGQAGSPGLIPQVQAGEIRTGTFISAARGHIPTNWTIAYPPGVDPLRPVKPATATTPAGGRLPVCVVLHGKGMTARGLVTIGYPWFLAAAVKAGVPPFALAAVDGGDRYWHRRKNGEDPGGMVLHEWIPLLAEFGLAAHSSDRIALLGWSMGGYGSLLLASVLGPTRVAAVVAESAALWRSADDAAAGAFDDVADYRAHDVFARRRELSQIPIRIDCGLADPFHTADENFASGLAVSPAGDFGAGDHSQGYWRAKAPKAIEFIGNHLRSS
jgi:pimeloyl-ACP methyl ester carboxylesterase